MPSGPLSTVVPYQTLMGAVRVLRFVLLGFPLKLFVNILAYFRRRESGAIGRYAGT